MTIRFYLLFVLFLGWSVIASAQPVSEDVNWDDRFGPVGTDGEVKAIAVSGDDIYVAGTFNRAGGIWSPRIARWNITSRKWYGLGSASDLINGTIAAIAVSGGKLYVGGQIDGIGSIKARNLATYDLATATWSAWTDGAGGGLYGGYVTSLQVVGTDIYVGGQFTAIGTILANNIARWDGVRFHKLGGGLNAAVSAITYAGGQLYAGGNFITADTSSAEHLAQWNGQTWRAIGDGTNGPVRAVLVDGGYLYVGGTFYKAGGISVQNLARYDLATGEWSNMGGGVRQIAPDPRLPPSVNAIQPADGKIYVAGIFTLAGEIDKVGDVAVWDGSRIRGLRNDITDVYSHGIGGAGIRVDVMVLVGGDLYLGGLFDTAYGQVALSDTYNPAARPVYANNLVRWGLSDREWHPVGTSPDNTLSAVAVDGDDVYFSGLFHSIGGMLASKVARWNSRTGEWSDAGAGLDSAPAGFASYGGRLYAARRNYLYMLDRGSNSWKKQGDSLPGGAGFSFAVGSSGMYAGNLNGVFRLGASGWALIATLGLNVATIPIAVSAMATDGDKLYIGGHFTVVGNTQARNVATLDLKSGLWSRMGKDGLGYGYSDEIRGLKVGQGRVYAGGNFVFDPTGERRFNHVAEWDESSGAWVPLGEGMNNPVNSLDIRDGLLYAAGSFTMAGDVGASHVAIWDGEVWSTLGSGVDGNATAVAVGRNQVIVIGLFQQAGWKPSFLIGRWSDRSLSAPVTGMVDRQRGELEIVPNPCSTVASVSFTLPVSSEPVRFELYDLLGRIALTPIEGTIEAGNGHIQLDVSGLASGVYYCKLQQGKYIAAQPIVVTR